MNESPSLSAGTVAVRALLVGAGFLLLFAVLAQVAGPAEGAEYFWPTVIALSIAALVGSFMMAWTRRGWRRWAWAATGTLLLLVTVGFCMLTIPVELVPAGE